MSFLDFFFSDLKELFLKIPTFDIKNIYGENLTQYAVKNQTPESLIFLINNGVNPYEKSSNNKNTFDYQEEYGNVVTETILNDFEKTMQLEKNQDHRWDGRRRPVGRRGPVGRVGPVLCWL